MMDAVLDEAWRDVFERAARLRAEKRRKADVEAELDQRDDDKRKKVKAEKEEREEQEQLEVLVATSTEMAAFEERLDEYDTQTVHALMENGEALDRVRHELEHMLDTAYRLPDGRRVFRTEDGRRVFDEHGAEVPAKVVVPGAIPAQLPTWEAFKAQKDEEARLQTERGDLLTFQAKVDDVRDRVSKGDISKSELDALDADLQASAPPSVRQKLGLATPDADQAEAPRPDATALLPQASLASDVLRRGQPQPAPM